MGIKEYDNILNKYEEVAELIGIDPDYSKMKRKLIRMINPTKLTDPTIVDQLDYEDCDNLEKYFNLFSGLLQTGDILDFPSQPSHTCRHGTSCYRKSMHHLTEYKHPNQRYTWNQYLGDHIHNIIEEKCKMDEGERRYTRKRKRKRRRRKSIKTKRRKMKSIRNSKK